MLPVLKVFNSVETPNYGKFNNAANGNCKTYLQCSSVIFFYLPGRGSKYITVELLCKGEGHS